MNHVRCHLCLLAASLVFLGGELLSSNMALSQQPLPAEGDELQLIAVLESDAELFDKAKVCQRLAIIGTAKSVPVVAKLLSDPELSHYARIALESNPSADVDMAFQKALGELNGRRLVGVINSVAARDDKKADQALIDLSSSDDTEVAAAAVSALGTLATPRAIATIQRKLTSESSMQQVAADACLTAADRLLSDGDNDDALIILQALRKAELPEHVNVAARFGEIRAGSQKVNELMIEYLSEDDPALFRIGLELAHSLTDTDSSGQLVKQLESLSPVRQVLLMHVLGDRGDASVLETVVQATDSKNSEMKIASVRVLGRLGDSSVVPILLKAATSDDETLAASASESLAVIGGDEVDSQLANRLKVSEGQERLVLVKVAGRRAMSHAIPMLLKFASSDDPKLRDSAINGLGMTIGLEDFPQLVDRMLASGESPSAKAMKEALQKACQRMGNREAASKVLLDRLTDASATAKVELMDLLIYVGGAEALAGVKANAEGEDDSAVDAATQALGKWLTPDAAGVLLELAESGNPAYRVRCLRGYIRIIRQFGLKSGQRLQMSKKAFAAATRDEERKLVLDTLTRFPLPQGLRMITPHLKTSSLSEDACLAAVKIGEKIVDGDPKLVSEVMNKVVEITMNDETANRAKVLVTRSR